MLRSRSSPQQFCGVQRFQIHHARAFYQRQKKIRHLSQHVKHGQHAQQRVAWADFDPVEYCFHFSQQVRVGEHHAFGIGGGS
jgi:hypothetical protein